MVRVLLRIGIWLVRDKKARELFGPYAWLNFPGEEDQKPGGSGQ